MSRQPGVRNRTGRQFTDAEIRRMVDRRRDGIAWAVIAKPFGVSEGKVRDLVRAATAGGGAGAPMSGQ